MGDPASQCLGKHSYETRSEAKKAIIAYRSKFGPIGSYRCPHCNKLHLGHTRTGRRSKQGRKG